MKKRFLLFLLICLTFLSSAGCHSTALYADTSFLAMDTVITLRLPANVSEQVRADCGDYILQLESVFSRTVPSSEVSHFNRAEKALIISDDCAAVLRSALAVAKASDGAFDPTVAPIVTLWSITSDTPAVPDENSIQRALDAVGYEKLTLTEDNRLEKSEPAVQIDLGGCAKGYACAAAVRYLQSQNVPRGIVSFGGNIGVFGQKEDGTPWKIAIKDPVLTSETAGYLSVFDGYVSVSGDYERYAVIDGIRYHHIFDTATGFPADSGVHAVVVWSEDAVAADALSTALFVLGAEEGLSLYRDPTRLSDITFEAIWYLTDGTTCITDGIGDRYEHISSQFTEPETEKCPC
ncbi:MAG: FAD:protein FMN transferase [Clostridia bacterium]|nr:FAD:protein FMN transferase [Clostridia bacterium]